jgi:hypothetical protein
MWQTIYRRKPFPAAGRPLGWEYVTWIGARRDPSRSQRHITSLGVELSVATPKVAGSPCGLHREGWVSGLSMRGIAAALIVSIGFLVPALSSGATAPSSTIGAAALGLFPPSPLPLQNNPQTTISESFSSSASSWRPGLDEREVFQALVSHAPASSSTEWRLRIGKGGQIYSLRTPAGEVIAPQGRFDSTWVDSVFQPVAVYIEKNAPQSRNVRDPSPTYALQTGVYERDPVLKGRFYAPLLAAAATPDGHGYAVLNWYQQAHIPSLNTSGLLVYAQYRDAGDGIIEVTYILYNFGNLENDILDRFNLPWSVIRSTTYSSHFVSSPDNGLTEKMGRFADKLAMPVRDTGGWVVFANNNPTDSSNALGIVFGLEASNSLYRYGQGGSPLLQEFVSTVATSFPLAVGEAFLYRYYLVVGTYAEVRNRAPTLVPDTAFKPITFNLDADPHVNQPRNVETGYPPSCVVGYPASNYKPLFLLEKTRSGEDIASPNPYTLSSSSNFNGKAVYYPYDGATKYLGLLGFVPTTASNCGK